MVYGVNLPKYFCYKYANEPKAVKGYLTSFIVVLVALGVAASVVVAVIHSSDSYNSVKFSVELPALMNHMLKIAHIHKNTDLRVAS